MEEYAVRRLALILAVQAEIEGMKVENRRRESIDLAAAYDEHKFEEKAMELENLAHVHTDQLFA